MKNAIPSQPPDVLHDKDIWAPYLPHTTAVVSIDELQGLEDRLQLLVTIGRHQRSLVHYNTMGWACQQAFSCVKSRQGDPRRVQYRYAIGLFSRQQDRYAEAEKEFEEALKDPGDAPFVITVRQGLAGALNGQKKYAKSEPVIKEALDLARTTLDPKDGRILLCMSELGLTLADLEKYAEAKEV